MSAEDLELALGPAPRTPRFGAGGEIGAVYLLVRVGVSVPEPPIPADVIFGVAVHSRET